MQTEVASMTNGYREEWLPRAALRNTALAVLLSATAACSRDSATPAAAAAPAGQSASTAQPSDPRLAGLYQQSCKACHAIAAGGAPLTGDRAAWAPRWAKGAEALRSSTIRGLNGMPPGGQCFACTPADYDALIRFMAGQ